MDVLVVARCKDGRFAPFITEQVNDLEKYGISCHYFGIKHSGILGYLRQLPEYFRTIRLLHPDVVHAHYGLSGLFASFQRMVPVVTTFHGSDINNPSVLYLSRWAMVRSRFCVFVSSRFIEKVGQPREYALIPCGIDLNDYPIVEKREARYKMSLSQDKKYVLFSGAFDNPIKNAQLAKSSVSLLGNVELLELSGYSRREVALLMQAVDVLLMTSLTEGSPQVIKEALACGCPIVSVDVGDVRSLIEGVDGCYLAERNPQSIADCLKKAFDFSGRTKGREVIIRKKLTNDIIASQLIEVYHRVSESGYVSNS